MTRSQAYKILHLHQDASEQEIRKAYKRLALKVHPDINPSPDANERFILLNQAMELLLAPELPSSQPQKKRAADETDDERKVRMDEARRRYEQQQRFRHEENMSYYRSLTSGFRWKVFNVVVIISTTLSFVLAADLFLPSRFIDDTLEAVSPVEYQGVYAHKITALALEKTGVYYARNNQGAWLSDYPNVEVETTFWLKTPLKFRSNDNFYIHTTTLDFHVGAIRFYLIPFLLIPLGTRIRRRMKLSFVFFYHFSFWFMGAFCLYLIFTENRLANILTFGFA